MKGCEIAVLVVVVILLIWFFFYRDSRISQIWGSQAGTGNILAKAQQTVGIYKKANTAPS